MLCCVGSGSSVAAVLGTALADITSRQNISRVNLRKITQGLVLCGVLQTQ